MGVEEEFLLVDPVTCRSTPQAAKVLEQARASTELPAELSLHTELHDTQVESVTGICADERALRAQLDAGRRALAAAAGEGTRVVATGTPPLSSTQPVEARSERFARIERVYAGIVDDYDACGCHVHVGVPDQETAVAVVNHLRPWLPTLLAAAVNSPYCHGRDTGHGSWRMVQQSRFPGAGVTPWFSCLADYQRELSALVDAGVLVDDRMTFWLARPSPTLPTVEFRVADTVPTVDDALLHALLARALVRTALAEHARGKEADRVDEQVLAAALWSASRYGLDGPAVDPFTANRVHGRELFARMLRRLAPSLEEQGDLESVRTLLAMLRGRGTGAQRQRRHVDRGGPEAVVGGLAVGGSASEVTP